MSLKAFDPDLPPMPAGGRPTRRKPMTERQAKKEAARLMRDCPPSGQQPQVISLLAVAGVLTADQISEAVGGLSTRSLSKYMNRHLLDNVVMRADRRQALWNRLGGKKPPHLYTLGALGHALVPYFTDALAPTGYHNQKVDRVTHDLLCNAVIPRLMIQARRWGYEVLWHNRYGAAVGWESSDKTWRRILEPDGLIELFKEDKYHAYLIEFHQEDSKRRALAKVDTYHETFHNWESYWKKAWDVKTFPKILTVFTHKAPGYAYMSKLIPEGSSPLHWYGKSLRQALQDPNPFSGWFDYKAETRRNV